MSSDELLLTKFQIKYHAISVVLVGIMILITVIILPNNIDAYNIDPYTQQTFENNTLHAHTLDSMVNQTNVVKKTSPQINVGHGPGSIVYVQQTNTIYVANTDSDSISVIDGTNNIKIKDIPVGKRPSYIYAANSNIYVANTDSDSISVIDGTNN